MPVFAGRLFRIDSLDWPDLIGYTFACLHASRSLMALVYTTVIVRH